MEKIRKQYEFNKKTMDKIEKLKYAKEQEYPESKVYEKDIIVDAVDYYYSAKFGKDVFDQTIGRFENVLGNMLQKVLNEYANKFAISLENIHFQNDEVREMLFFILKSNNILPENQNQINALVMLNTDLEKSVKEAVLIKKDIQK